MNNLREAWILVLSEVGGLLAFLAVVHAFARLLP
jgi:hypothetical protein